MVQAVQDISESSVLRAVLTGFEIGGIEEYSINRQRGSVGIDFSIILPKVIGSDLTAGMEINFKDIGGTVTSKENRSNQGGYGTVINGVSRVGELLRKAPMKTLMYMSMTQAEKEEFEVTCSGEDGKPDYNSLDYIPLIRICDPKKFTGGWRSNEVVRDLIHRAGFSEQVNVYNFWVKQVQASNSSSYFESAMSLVSFLRPIIHVDEEKKIVFILDRPILGGSAELSRFTEISQRQIYGYESKANYFDVRGGYGEWKRERSQVKAEPEREANLVTTTYQEKPIMLVVNLTGDVEVTKKLASGATTEQETTQQEAGVGPLQLASWLSEPMREKHTITEVWRLDPYGNFKALLSRHTVGYNMTQQAIVLDVLDEYTYDFLTEDFERPRPTGRKTTSGKYTWTVSQGLVSYRAYAGKVTVTSTAWTYAPDGALLQETVTTSEDVVRLGIGNTYVTLDCADTFYREPGSKDEALVQRMTVDERVIKYRQMTPDLYETATTHRRLGALPRQLGQENYSVENAVVRGRVPKHPMRYRSMLVYSRNTEDIDTSIDVPVLTTSNPNIIDWGDADAILGRIADLAAQENISERVISIPGDIPVDIGWNISLPEVNVGSKLESDGGQYKSEEQAVPEIVPSNWAYIVAWSKVKRAGQPSVDTVITIEAR